MIADWLIRLTTAQRNWGFGLCFPYLRNIKGFERNHKKVYRTYRELELNLRIKPRKRLVRERPEPLGTLRRKYIDAQRVKGKGKIEPPTDRSYFSYYR